MMSQGERVVFDCNIFFQALISPSGPAGRVLDAAAEGYCSLFVSDFIFDELRDVAARPQLAERFKLTVDKLAIFIDSIEEFAVSLVDVPFVFAYPRDPKDARYVDLALAASAKLIVSRDQDLLALNDEHLPESRDFRTRFPELKILTPTQLLDSLNLC